MAITTTTSQTELRSSFVRMDAEFFRPEHLTAYKRVEGINGRERLGHLCEKVTQGSNPVFSENGFPCVNGKNVYFGTMQAGEPNYVSAHEFKRLDTYRVRPDDILITLKHATKIGRAWIVEDDKPRIFARNIGLIRLSRHSPVRASVLLMYLWTRLGQLSLDRCATGGTSGQITLPISELKHIPVPPFPEQTQIQVEDLFQRSRSAARRAEETYTQARQFLHSELGLEHLRFDSPVGYTAQFSEIEEARRSDAQHYQPRFTKLLDHISSFPTKKVRDIRTYNRRGVQPVYVQNGEIAVINSQHLGQKHIDYEGLQKTTRSWFLSSPESHVKPNDLLIYSTGAYVGRTNVYLSTEKALASNHVNILRLAPEIDAAYMALVFQSNVGQFQTQRHARGSAQAELYPADIDRFVVPLIDREIQGKIGNLVRKSLAKQTESKLLLDKAKTRVEQLIEEAVKS